MEIEKFEEQLEQKIEKKLDSSTNKKHRRSKGDSQFKITAAALLLSAGLLIVCFWLLSSTITTGALSLGSAYSERKNEVAEKVYDTFYEKSYTAAEASHHVSNKVSISLGTLKEEAKLEVLKVSNVEYITPEEEEGTLFSNILDAISDFFVADNVVSWLEVPGYGVFTVNLQSAEFIVDADRQYVLLRVPLPELSEFTIDYANVELLNFEDTGLFKNTAQVGEDLAREQLEKAELQMRQDLIESQRFYQGARDATENILTNLVKELNPSMPDITVEVEFIE